MIKYAVTNNAGYFVTRVVKENLFSEPEVSLGSTNRLQNCLQLTEDEANAIAKDKNDKEAEGYKWNRIKWSVIKVEILDGGQYVIMFNNNSFLRKIVGEAGGMLKSSSRAQYRTTDRLQNSLLFASRSLAEDTISSYSLGVAKAVAVSARIIS